MNAVPLWTPDDHSVSEGSGWRNRENRVLLVVPHPDDESYGCAGTLARLAAQENTSVVLLVLTSGEAATIGRDRGIAPEELARIREGRLERVREWLGLDGLLLARLPDGGLSRCPLPRLGATIREAIDLFDPQVVLGHDPRGVNAHPDHIASHWALRVALPGSAVRRFGMLAHDLRSARSAAPRLLFSTPAERIHWTIDLTEREIDVKERCLIEHEAIITLDPTIAAEREISLRPAYEQWEFFGEPDGMQHSGPFDALPAELPSL